jgi:excisionase family DNA binding protein
MDQELYTVVEAANFLRVSKWTVRAWLSSGRLGAVKLGSRTLLRKQELNELVENNYKRRNSNRVENS